MKKIIALILTAILLLSVSASAETRYAKCFEVCVKDMSMTIDSQTVALQPYLQLRLCVPEDRTAMQVALEIRKEGELMAGLWLEEDGKAKVTFSNADSCICLEEGKLFHLLLLQQYLGVDLSDDESLKMFEELPNMLYLLEEFLQEENLREIMNNIGTTEEADEGFHVNILLPEEMTMQGTVSIWSQEVNEGLFDLTGRTEAAYNMREGFLGSSVLSDASAEIEQSLMQDESFLQLLMLLDEKGIL